MIGIGHSGDQTQTEMAMSEQMEKEVHGKVQPGPPIGERTMQVDTFALLSIVMIAGSLRMTEIVGMQSSLWGLGWFIFIQPIAFLVFFISGLAEAGRSPFDLPETENELIGGFATEYGGMKFGLFFGAEYIHTVVFSFIVATLFLGGWNGPLAEQVPLLGFFYLLAKVAVMVFIIIWVRASIPRVRFDKMMNFCWKFLLPLGLVNLAVTALVIAIFSF